MLGRQSPIHGPGSIDNASPNYSPTNPQTKQSPYMAGRAAIASGVKYSPAYSPGVHGITPASPNYSPMGSQRGGMMQGSAMNSPAYSPSMSAANYSHRSPNYSPSAPGGTSGISMPSAGVQFPQSNMKQQSYSPSYSPSSAVGFGKSPGYSKHIASPISPTLNSPYGISPLPNSTHSPKIASSLPQQQYIPPTTNRTAYNPKSPVYKQEEQDSEEEND